MRVGLFVPCYVDQLYPDVAMASVELLEQHGCQVEFPTEQTCCGQPMANTGCTGETRPLAERFLKIFGEYDYVVGPSASCVSMIRHHYEEYLEGKPGFDRLKERTFEVCEFLHDVLKVGVDNEGKNRGKSVANFPYKVGIHQSCHGLRELRIGGCSEQMLTRPGKVRSLLEAVPGIEFTTLSRTDECCGFGGTFAVAQEAVSVMMGEDRLADHLQAGTQVLTATDMSCLMHLEGIVRRKKMPFAIMHVAEILAGRKPKFIHAVAT